MTTPIRTRVPAGVSTGGRFTTSRRTELPVSLKAIDVAELTAPQRERLEGLVRACADEVGWFARRTPDGDDDQSEVLHAAAMRQGAEAIAAGEHVAYLEANGYTADGIRRLAELDTP